METNNNIQQKIDDTLESLDVIETVHVSPFFKDKTMQFIFAEKEQKQIIGSWFSPKLQLATLVCLVALNVIAFIKLQETNYDNNISEFAESYGLSTSTEPFLLK